MQRFFQIKETTHSNKDGSITKGTLTSSTGSTSLVLANPGAVKFLELVKSPYPKLRICLRYPCFISPSKVDTENHLQYPLVPQSIYPS
jgi:hypothetical protein